MNNFKDFAPENKEEAQWIENYNDLSKYISDGLKRVNENDRLSVLKSLNPSDLSLMNLFVLSLKNEEYEICEIANKLLKERGLEFKSDKR